MIILRQIYIIMIAFFTYIKTNVAKKWLKSGQESLIDVKSEL